MLLFCVVFTTSVTISTSVSTSTLLLSAVFRVNKLSITNFILLELIDQLSYPCLNSNLILLISYQHRIHRRYCCESVPLEFFSNYQNLHNLLICFFIYKGKMLVTIEGLWNNKLLMRSLLNCIASFKNHISIVRKK